LYVVIFVWGCGSNQSSVDALLKKPLDSLSIQQISNEIRKNPYNGELFMRRSELYYNNQLIDSAINDAIIATRLDSLKPEHFIKLSEMYLSKGNSEEAKNTLEKCNRINPDNDEVLVKIATIYFYVKDYKKTNENLDLAAEVNPHNAEMFFIRGMLHREKKENKAAILNFQKATENNPEYFEAFMMLGLINAELKDSIAIQYYNAAININAKDIQPYYNLAMFYQENNNVQKALAEYQFIIKNIDKSYIHAFFNQGYINMVYLDEFEKAISYFDSTLALKADYVEAVYNKGYCYEQLKNKAKAIEFYEQAKTIVPNFQLAIDGLNRLDKKNKTLRFKKK